MLENGKKFRKEIERSLFYLTQRRKKGRERSHCRDLAIAFLNEPEKHTEDTEEEGERSHGEDFAGDRFF